MTKLLFHLSEKEIGSFIFSSLWEAFWFLIAYMALPPETAPSFSAQFKPKISATRTALLDQQWCNPSSFPTKKIGSTTTTTTSSGRTRKTGGRIIFLIFLLGRKVIFMVIGNPARKKKKKKRNGED